MVTSDGERVWVSGVTVQGHRSLSSVSERLLKDDTALLCTARVCHSASQTRAAFVQVNLEGDQ